MQIEKSPAESPPKFDAGAIRAHVELLHSLASGQDGVLVVATYYSNPAGAEDVPGAVTHHRIGDVDGMVDAILSHSGVLNANPYVGLQVMRRGLARGKRGTENDIVAVLGLVADLDADTGKAGNMPVPASFELETSPGNRQPFVLFDKPLSAAEAKPLAKALQRATGGDHGTGDISHVWRVPGTLNWPNRKKLERGRPPEPAPVSIAVPFDGSLHGVEDLRQALSVWSGPTSTAGATVALGDLPEVGDIEVSQRAADLLAACDVGDRSAHAARVVEQLAFDGHGAEAAAALFLAATGDWLGRYATEVRARADFERLWAKPAAQDHVAMREAGVRLSAGVMAKSLVAANDNEPDDDDLPVVPAVAQSAGLPDALCYPPGAVGDFARFIVSCARFPSPHLSLVASLAFVAAMVGRRYKGPTGLRTNLYVVGLAESGFGKDITIRATAALADSTSHGTKASEALFADKIGSLPGLANKLRKAPSCVVVQDEFGRFLAEHAGANVASHRADIATALMELTGAPAGFWGGQEKAAGNIARIVQPCFSMHGVSTPSTFWSALSSGNISEGLLGRLVLVDVGDTQPVKVRRPAGNIDDIPIGLSNQVANLLGGDNARFLGPFHALSGDSTERPFPMMTAEWAPGVDDLFEEFDDRMRARKDTVDPRYRPILNRVGENAARLALIVAVGCDPKAPIITAEIQEWANQVAEHSLGVILGGADENIADNEKSAEYLRVRTMVYRADEAGITRGKIIASLRGAMDGRRITDILDSLRSAREISLAKQTTPSGQTRNRYWRADKVPGDAEVIH